MEQQPHDALSHNIPETPDGEPQQEDDRSVDVDAAEVDHGVDGDQASKIGRVASRASVRRRILTEPGSLESIPPTYLRTTKYRDGDKKY